MPSLFPLPCAWQSLKGVSGDVIILEEAAYCDPGLVAEVVVPLLSMQQSVLLCISTILDSGNHYTKMMELVDGNSPTLEYTHLGTAQPHSLLYVSDFGIKVFDCISITLVCEDCMKTGAQDSRVVL